LILSVLALGAASHFTVDASAHQIATPDPGRDRTVRAIAACGVAAAEVRITYDDDLQSDLVRIGDLGGSDEARFHCLRKVVFPDYFVDVSAAPQREAYYAFTRREDHKLARAHARAWLKARGLLDRVPRFDPGTGVEAFARSIESACSIRPGDALEARGASGITIRQAFFGDSMTTKFPDDFSCLTRMFDASNANEHDIILGFIGNAAAGEGDR
jgi:hypothetical protein